MIPPAPPTKKIPGLLLLAACTLMQVAASAQLTLRFSNVAGEEPIVSDTSQYKTYDGHPYSISLLQYYISNIVLNKADGSQYIIPRKESYMLIKQSAASSRQQQFTIPEGNYTSLSFLVGIDSATSTAPVAERTGVLDPAHGDMAGEGMYWTWNSGYIFFKLEGTSPDVPADPSGFREFQYHIGGYGGYNTPTINNLRIVTCDFVPQPQQLKIGKTFSTTVEIAFNLSFFLDTINMATQHHVMLSPVSRSIADAYARSFAVKAISYTRQ